MDNNFKEEQVKDFFQDVLDYKQSDKFKSILDFVISMPECKPYNVMLIKMQNPNATFVASKNDWRKKYNRKVKPGAKPLIVMVPFGPVGRVYDIADTEGDVIADEIINPFKTNDVFTQEQFDCFIKMMLANEGIRYEEEALGKNLAGYIQLSSYHEIYLKEFDYVIKSYLRMVINSSFSVTEKVTTMLHELAHYFCGHLGSISKRIPLGRTNLTLQCREFEAETTCYLLCKKYGIKNNSEGYLDGYLRTHETVPNISLETVLSAAGKIERLLKGELYLKNDLVLDKNINNQFKRYITLVEANNSDALDWFKRQVKAGNIDANKWAFDNIINYLKNGKSIYGFEENLNAWYDEELKSPKNSILPFLKMFAECDDKEAAKIAVQKIAVAAFYNLKAIQLLEVLAENGDKNAIEELELYAVNYKVSDNKNSNKVYCVEEQSYVWLEKQADAGLDYAIDFFAKYDAEGNLIPFLIDKYNKGKERIFSRIARAYYENQDEANAYKWLEKGKNSFADEVMKILYDWAMKGNIRAGRILEEIGNNYEEYHSKNDPQNTIMGYKLDPVTLIGDSESTLLEDNCDDELEEFLSARRKSVLKIARIVDHEQNLEKNLNGVPDDLNADFYFSVVCREPKVQYYLAQYYLEKDFTSGFKWLKRSCQAGYMDAVDSLVALATTSEKAREYLLTLVKTSINYEKDCPYEVDTPYYSEKEKQRADIFYPGYKLAEAVYEGKIVSDIIGIRKYCLWAAYSKIAGAFDLLKKNTDENNENHCYDIGLCYYKGYSVPKDDTKAVQWLKLAARKNHAEACYLLANCYAYGLGVERDDVVSDELYKTAAENGCAAAEYAIGLKLEIDNLEEAFIWFQRAAVKYYTKAICKVAEYIIYEKVTYSGDKNFVEEYLKNADDRSGEASYLLGCYYALKKDIGDYDKIDEAYREALLDASMKGHIKAAVKLAELYYDEYDIEEARYWALKTAQAGNPHAMILLGNICSNCYDDHAEALRWYERCAKMSPFEGQDEALVKAAQYYDEGKYVEKNKRKAIKYYKAATLQGNSKANDWIWELLEENKNAVLPWLKKNVEANDTAKIILAYYYFWQGLAEPAIQLLIKIADQNKVAADGIRWMAGWFSDSTVIALKWLENHIYRDNRNAILLGQYYLSRKNSAKAIDYALLTIKDKDKFEYYDELENNTTVYEIITKCEHMGEQRAIDFVSKALKEGNEHIVYALAKEYPQERYSFDISKEDLINIFEKVANLNGIWSGDICVKLGNIYQNGLGVPLNLSLALQWYIKGANKPIYNKGRINEKIAKLYELGFGTNVDYTQAACYYAKAANNHESRFLTSFLIEDHYHYFRCAEKAAKLFAIDIQKESNFKEACYWMDKIAFPDERMERNNKCNKEAIDWLETHIDEDGSYLTIVKLSIHNFIMAKKVCVYALHCLADYHNLKIDKKEFKKRIKGNDWNNVSEKEIMSFWPTEEELMEVKGIRSLYNIVESYFSKSVKFGLFAIKNKEAKDSTERVQDIILRIFCYNSISGKQRTQVIDVLREYLDLAGAKLYYTAGITLWGDGNYNMAYEIMRKAYDLGYPSAEEKLVDIVKEGYKQIKNKSEFINIMATKASENNSNAAKFMSWYYKQLSDEWLEKSWEMSKADEQNQEAMVINDD